MQVEVTSIPREFDRYSKPADVLEACFNEPLLHYPPLSDRWHISTEEWNEMAKTGKIVVPDGPWVALGHLDREIAKSQGVSIDPADPNEIDADKKAVWRKEYPLVTDRGLPVHPMGRLGVTSEILDKKTNVLHKLGMATGIGRERRYGALNTGALLLARVGLSGEVEYPVVTELRNNKLRRSFPGGYIEQNESIADGCIRESNEELCITEACERAGIPWNVIKESPHALWKIAPSVTGPCTLNAWLAEHFLVINATHINDMQGVVLSAGESDIHDVEWRSARELQNDPSLLSTHKRALRAHLETITAP